MSADPPTDLHAERWKREAHAAIERQEYDDATDAIRRLARGQYAPEESGIASRWSSWSSGPPDLTVAPAPRRWLVRHPGVSETALGDGMIPMSKVGIIAADGGAGKTTVATELGVAVVTGRRWLDHFEIGEDAVNRRVLILLGEDDAEEVHRRLYKVCEAHGLSGQERRMVTERAVVLGLAGEDVRLLAAPGKHSSPAPTETLRELQRLLADGGGEDGWGLIIIDPLARFAPEDAETDNARATMFVRACERLTEAPGNPAVIVLHHASLDGVRSAQVRGRGVTGLRNGARWEAYLRRDDASGMVAMKLSKSNVAMTMRDELMLSWAGGVYRVVADHERQSLDEDREAEAAAEALERAAAKERIKREAIQRRTADDVDALVAAVAEAGPAGFANAEVAGAAAGLPEKRARTALAAAEKEGRVIVLGSTRDRQILAPEHVNGDAE